MESRFVREYCFGKVVVNIEMDMSPKYSDFRTYIWGFPYANKNMLLLSSWDDTCLNSVAGYFFALRESNDKLELATDILGGYRMYYVKQANHIFISNDYSKLLPILSRENTLSLNEEQYLYWMKHRFTLNQKTLFCGLYKFSPASHLIIDSEGIHETTYFQNKRRTSSKKMFLRCGYENMKYEIENLFRDNLESTFIMFYSGGADSTCLLLMCKELGIPLKCILIQYLPYWNLNQKEMMEARQNLEKLGQEYEIIDVNLNQALVNHGSKALKDLLFNRHLGVHFYEAYKVIYEKYGNDIVIINGQSADSILSFGPSEYTLGNYAKRMIIAMSGRWWMAIPKLLCLNHKVGYLPACTKDQAICTIMDDTNYIFLIDKECPYSALIESELETIKKLGLSSFETMRMYAKIISFLQGSDNQVVIKAANYFGITKIVMPFTSPNFIYTTVKYKNNFYEIFKPKYFVRELTKKHFRFKRFSSSKDEHFVRESFDMSNFEEKFDRQYIEYLFSFLEREKHIDD